MKIIHKLSEHVKGLFFKKSNIDIKVDVHKLLDVLSSPSHIKKINDKSDIELIKLLNDIGRKNFDNTGIVKNLAQILNIDNQSISVEKSINLLKRKHNRKAIFNLLRIDNEYITTEEGLRQFILRNIKQSPEVIEDLLNNTKAGKLLFKYIDSKCLLNHAIKCDEDKIVKLLVKKGAPVDMSTLYHCIKYGKFEIFDFLIQIMKNELLIGKKYHELFDYAIEYKRFDIIHIILCDIDVNLKDSKDQTLLHHAVELGNLEIVKQLIKKGAKLNCVDQNGCTPLNLAIKSRNVDITNLLLDACADIRYAYSPSEGNIIRVYTKEDYEFFIPLLNKRNDPWVMQKNPGTTLQQASSANILTQIISVV